MKKASPGRRCSDKACTSRYATRSFDEMSRRTGELTRRARVSLVEAPLAGVRRNT